MFSSRKTVCGSRWCHVWFGSPASEDEFVLLSGSKQPHYLFTRLDGRTEQMGLQVQETARTLKLLTLASPPVNTGMQGRNTCARVNPWADLRKMLSVP